MPRTEPRSATYQCLNCRLAQRAEVRRHGRTKLATRGAARADANTSLAMLLALKRCPRCGYFDKGVAEHNRKTVRFAQISLGVMLAVIMLCLFAIARRSVFLVGAVVLVAGFIALVRMVRHRYPLDVEARVTLVDPIPTRDGWWQ